MLDSESCGAEKYIGFGLLTFYQFPWQTQVLSSCNAGDRGLLTMALKETSDRKEDAKPPSLGAALCRKAKDLHATRSQRASSSGLAAARKGLLRVIFEM
jgi:hypothetical protein